MADSNKNAKFFWLLNFLVIIAAFGVMAKNMILKNNDSPYRLQLYEQVHYTTPGFDLNGDLSKALKFSPGKNVGSDLSQGGTRRFMSPGITPYEEFTIITKFDYTSQYNSLQANADVIPAIQLPGLGDSYEIYLNGNLVVSKWNVVNGEITLHQLARGTVYPINPNFFLKGDNVLAFRIYGEPATVDTGLIVTDKYIIDDISQLNLSDYSQIAFGGICLAVAITFLIFFLLYSEKKLNLYFAITALSISLYAFFRAGAFLNIISDYEIALRLEVLSLFTFAYFITVLIYISDKKIFNLVMKIYTAIYIVFSFLLLLPGHQFVLDSIKAFFILFAPFIIYAFTCSVCIPLIKGAKTAKKQGCSAVQYILEAFSGTLQGNMFIGTLLPIVVAMFDQISYVAFSYQEVVLSQYGFLFFFANVTFAIASDNAKMHSKLMTIGGELRNLIAERESELEQKSGEIEQAKTEQEKFREAVSKEIRAPLGEIIGSIELQMLRTEFKSETSNWLKQLLEAQRDIRKRVDDFLGVHMEYSEGFNSDYSFDNYDSGYNKIKAPSNPGGTRHLFVINPKSFVTLKDLKISF